MNNRPIGAKGQMKAIKDHLESGKTITSMEAFELYGCTRLAAKIHELRESGMDIKSIWCTGTNRYGLECQYVKYKL